MKVKNIVFSGFAAAILMGACGAADAATVSLISKDYADTKLQSKLTAGDNVAISDDNTISVDLTDYAQKTDVTSAITDALGEEGDVTKAITDAISGKQDALANADVLSGITAADVTNYDKAVTDSATALTNAATAQAAADKAQGEVDALETVVDGKANAADVYSKTEADELLAKKADLEDVYLKTETMTTAQINEAIDKVTSGEIDLQNYYTKEAADTKFVDTTEIEGYATDEELTAVSDVANAAATQETVTAIDTRLTTAEGEIDALQTATANLADFVDSEEIKAYSTTAEMNAAIEAAAYDDAALVARVTTNETAINTLNSEQDTQDANISANASAIEALQGAGYVVGTKTAGSYLVNFDANGNASYASVEIIGSDNNPIDLTTGAVK